MGKRSYNPAHFAILISLFCGALLFATGAQAQIAKVPNDDGRILFVNAEPPPPLHLTPRRAASMLETTAKRSIYLPPETSFTGKNRPGMNLDRDGAEKLVREAAERHRIDPALVRAVIETESNWNPSAISRKGAVGLMQLLPATAKGIAIHTGGTRFRVDDLYNPEINVRYGAWYLRHLLDRYGDEKTALAAYNAGQENVDRWRAENEPVQFPETRAYVSRVERLKDIYRRAYGRQLGLS